MTALDIRNVLSELYAAAGAVFQDRMQEMILYGSYARGDQDVESDIDILILADIPNNECWEYRKKLADTVDRLSLQYDVVVSLHIVDSGTFEKWNHVVPFYQRVKSEGVVISA